MFNTIRGYQDIKISRYQDTRIYRAILPDVLTSQDMLESKAYKDYYAFATGAVLPKAKTTYKKKDKEPVTSETASEFVYKSPRLNTQAMTKQPAKNTKAKGLIMLTEAALFEADQLKLATKKSKKDFHILHTSGSDDGVGKLSKYESESDIESWRDSEEEGDDDDDGNNDDESGNEDECDDVAESDDEQTESENDDDCSDEEEDVEESAHTQSHKEKFDYEESNDDDKSTDNEDDEEVKELYDDVNVNLGNVDAKMTVADQRTTEQHVSQEEEDAHVTLTHVHDARKAGEPLQSSSVSSDFTSKFLNLKNPALTNTEIASLMKTSASQDTIPPTPPTLFIPKVLALEIELSELKQTNQFAEAISFKSRIKDQVKAQVSKIMPKVEKKIRHSEDSLYALVASYNSDKDIISSYGDVVLLKRGYDDNDKDQDPSVGSDWGMKRRKTGKDADSSKDPRSKEKRSTSSSKEASNLDIRLLESLFIQRSQVPMLKTQVKIKIRSMSWGKQMNNPMTGRLLNLTGSRNLKDLPLLILTRIPNRTQELLVGLAFNLLKGTCKSLTELEYHLEECSKSTTKKFDWNNLESKPYPFNLRKPLLLIQDHRGRQIIPKDYFINKDAEYLKGGDSSRHYSTSSQRKRLMRTDELHKFSDGTLNDVRTALCDIDAGLRMEYLPMRK
nr:hypothetical protein [Tanacetum cinerariifolium]